MSTEFYWIAVAVVLIIGSARITRLLTFDHFPPIEKARNAYIDWTDKRAGTRGYGLLAYCPWCASPWITAANVLLGWWAGVFSFSREQSGGFTAWWIVNGIFAVAYLASIFMVNDTDTSEDD